MSNQTFPMTSQEKTALPLFMVRCTLEHKRFAILAVFRYIDQNPQSTEANIKRQMKLLYNMDPEVVAGAIGALVANGCFNSVKVWNYPNTPDVLRYTASKQPTPSLNSWVSSVISWRPEWENLVNEAVC